VRIGGSVDWLFVNDRRSALGFIMACAATVSALLLLTLHVPFWAYASLSPQHLRTDRIRVMHEVAALRLGRRPNLLLLGGSQIREAFPEDGFVAGRLNQLCARHFNVANLATTSQRPQSVSGLLRVLKLSPDSVVLIGVNPWRAVDGSLVDRFDPRVALPTDLDPVGETARAAFVRQADAMARRALILMSDMLAALGPVAAPVLPRHGPFESPQHQYRGGVATVAELQLDRTVLAVRASMAPKSAWKDATTIYLDVAEAVQRTGARTIFLIVPEPNVAPDSQRGDLPEVEAFVSALSHAPAAHLIDARRLMPDPSAFHDSAHFNTFGRKAAWPSLERLLVSAVECAPHEKRL